MYYGDLSYFIIENFITKLRRSRLKSQILSFEENHIQDVFNLKYISSISIYSRYFERSYNQKTFKEEFFLNEFHYYKL